MKRITELIKLLFKALLSIAKKQNTFGGSTHFFWLQIPGSIIFFADATWSNFVVSYQYELVELGAMFYINPPVTSRSPKSEWHDDQRRRL